MHTPLEHAKLQVITLSAETLLPLHELISVPFPSQTESEYRNNNPFPNYRPFVNHDLVEENDSHQADYDKHVMMMMMRRRRRRRRDGNVKYRIDWQKHKDNAR